MRSWRSPAAPVAATLAAPTPTLLIIVALTVEIFLTRGTEVVVAGGNVAVLMFFYLLHRASLRHADRAAQTDRRRTRDPASPASLRGSRVNGLRSGVAAHVQERVR